MFGGIQDIVARDGVNRHHRCCGVHRQVMVGRCRVTGDVVNAGSDDGGTVGQSRDVICRNDHAPAAVCLYLRSVGNAANGHGHRLTGLCGGHAADRQIGLRFCRVQDIVNGQGVNGDHWRRRIHQQICGGAGAVTGAVGGARRQRVIRFAETSQVRCRNGQRPVAGGICRCGIRGAVQHHGYRGACGQAGAGAAEGQILTFFGRVQYVISADGVKGQRRCRGIDIHVVCCRAAVTGSRGHRHADGAGAVIQGRHISRRNADAPVTVRVDHGGVAVAVQGHRHGVASGSVSCRTADHLGLAVFGGVQDIVTGNSVDGDNRSRSVHRQVMAGRCRVTGNVRHRSRNHSSTVGQGRNFRRRNSDAPAAVRLHQCCIRVTANRHGDSLTGLCGGHPADCQIGLCFGGIEDIVNGQGIDRDHRRSGIQRHYMRGISRVTADVRHANADVLTAVRQC